MWIFSDFWFVSRLCHTRAISKTPTTTSAMAATSSRSYSIELPRLLRCGTKALLC